MSAERSDRPTSRSRSPRRDSVQRDGQLFPLIITVPQRICEQLTNTEILDAITQESGISRIQFSDPAEIPDYNTGRVFFYDESTDRKITAFKLVQSTQLLDRFVNNEPEKIEVKILIPESMISMLIGKAGKQINNIQDVSRTFISIMERNEAIEERQVRVTGRPGDIETAIEKIYKIVVNQRSPPRSTPVSGSVLRFIVPVPCSGYLIGKHGAFIKTLRNKYNIDLKVSPSEGAPCNDQENLAVKTIQILSGKPTDCREAIPVVVDKILEAMHNIGSPQEDTIRILIPSYMSNKIIGPRNFYSGGSLIREMAHKSRGARIKVLSDKKKEKELKNTIITVDGSSSSKQDATILIFKELEKYRNPTSPVRRPRSVSPRRSPSGERRQYRTRSRTRSNDRFEKYERPPPRQERVERNDRPHRSERTEKRVERHENHSRYERYERQERQERPERPERYDGHRNEPREDRDDRPGTTSINITVPDSLVPRLIGRGGDSVKWLMNKTQSKVSFLNRGDEEVNTPEGGSARLCKISGTSSSISHAVKLLIEQMVKLEE